MAGSSNLGPLTSIFTQDASCTDEIGLTRVFLQPNAAYIAQGPLDARCYPSSYTPDRASYYSPGSDCPSGYTPACTSLNAIGDETETVYTCCPTQFEFNCLSVTDPQFSWQSTFGCATVLTTGPDGAWTLSPLTQISSGKTVVTDLTANFGGINAFSIQIRFQESTSSEESTASTTTDTDEQSSTENSTGSSSTITRTADIPSETGSKDEGGSEGGISAGAAAGIGVGAGAAVLLIAAVAIFLLLKRRRKRQTGVGNPHERPDLAPPRPTPYELPSSGEYPKPQELYVPPAELGGNQWQR